MSIDDVTGTTRTLSAAVAMMLLAAGCGAAETPIAGGTTTVTEPSVPPCTAEPAPSTASTAPSTVQPTSASTATSISTTALTSTTAAPATTTTVERDAVVAAHQESLVALGYWLGEIDGRFGPSTSHAATAFQKVEGLPRTGVLDVATVERLAVAVRPVGRSTEGTVLEVDVSRQVLLVVSGGQVDRVYDIATGASSTPTPPGQFEIYREIDGYRHAPLGTLYRPKYFNGGIALHGYTSVPIEPASHGCVRLTYAAIDDLWASTNAPVGTSVWVY